MHTHALRHFFAATLLLLATSTASAQLFRAYLSIDGVDTNPCTLPQPCRLLPAALAAVASGGEIWMLDSANYNAGPVNIDKSATILAVPGTLGSVVALGGNAIEISGASVNVTLRNLNIVPFPGNAGAIGVLQYGMSSRLLLQNCNVSGFTSGSGVRAVGADRSAVVVDSVFHDIFTAVIYLDGAFGTVSGSHFSNAEYAVHVLSMSASHSRAGVSRSTATRSTHGFIAEAYLTASARADISVIDSALDHMGYAGVWAHSELGAIALASVSGTQISHSNIAVSASNSGARVYASGNQVTQNLIGFYNQNAALFNSGGNNSVIDNDNNILGTITPVSGS